MGITLVAPKAMALSRKSRSDWMDGTAKDSCITVLKVASGGRPPAMTNW